MKEVGKCLIGFLEPFCVCCYKIKKKKSGCLDVFSCKTDDCKIQYFRLIVKQMCGIFEFKPFRNKNKTVKN